MTTTSDYPVSPTPPGFMPPTVIGVPSAADMLQSTFARYMRDTAINLTWDGRFTAPCPCGQVVDWNARIYEPMCSCPTLR